MCQQSVFNPKENYQNYKKTLDQDIPAGKLSGI
jgi:hypothetical protein